MSFLVPAIAGVTAAATAFTMKKLLWDSGHDVVLSNPEERDLVSEWDGKEPLTIGTS
jgi:hypothetical protein